MTICHTLSFPCGSVRIAGDIVYLHYVRGDFAQRGEKYKQKVLGWRPGTFDYVSSYRAINAEHFSHFHIFTHLCGLIEMDLVQ